MSGIASGGMKIDGVAVGLSRQSAKSQAVAAARPIDSQKAQENFAAEMTKRLQAVEDAKPKTDPRKSEDEIKALVASFTGTIEEIRNKFGAATANATMGRILDYTSDALNDDRIAMAVGETMRGLAEENAKLKDGAARAATADKLDHFKISLNRTSWSEQEKIGHLEKSSGFASLGQALNRYFGHPSEKLRPPKVFGTDFSWSREEEEKALAAAAKKAAANQETKATGTQIDVVA